MDGHAVRRVRRAVRVEQAIKYLEQRRERALRRAMMEALQTHQDGDLVEQVSQWQTLSEDVLLALWRYRGRWPTRLEMAEMLEAVQRYARAAAEEGPWEVGSARQAAIIGTRLATFVLDELSFDGPVYNTFCGRVILTPLSRGGAFADLRFGNKAEIG